MNDQVAVQMALAVRELLYQFWTLFERGDASVNPDEFDGLQRLVDPANVVDLQGGELRLEDLDRAKQCVRTSDGRHVTIFTSGLGDRARVTPLPQDSGRSRHPNPPNRFLAA